MCVCVCVCVCVCMQVWACEQGTSNEDSCQSLDSNKLS